MGWFAPEPGDRTHVPLRTDGSRGSWLFAALRIVKFTVAGHFVALGLWPLLPLAGARMAAPAKSAIENWNSRLGLKE